MLVTQERYGSVSAASWSELLAYQSWFRAVRGQHCAKMGYLDPRVPSSKKGRLRLCE